jgi:hypothetical protein
VFKVISITPFPEMPLSESLLPRSVRIEWSNRPAADFDSCLRRLLAADLPAHDNDRARFEYVLERIHQVAVFGTAYAQISISKISTYKFARNSLKIKERPRNPKTDAPATCYVPPKAKEIPLAEIDPRAWQPYLDYAETDATTPAEHAAMLEPASAPHPPDDDSGQREHHHAQCRA